MRLRFDTSLLKIISGFSAAIIIAFTLNAQQAETKTSPIRPAPNFPVIDTSAPADPGLDGKNVDVLAGQVYSTKLNVAKQSPTPTTSVSSIVPKDQVIPVGQGQVRTVQVQAPQALIKPQSTAQSTTAQSNSIPRIVQIDKPIDSLGLDKQPKIASAAPTTRAVLTVTPPSPSTSPIQVTPIYFNRKDETIVGSVPMTETQKVNYAKNNSATTSVTKNLLSAPAIGARWEIATSGLVDQDGREFALPRMAQLPSFNSNSPITPLPTESSVVDFSGSVKLGRYIPTEREELYRRRIISQSFKNEKSTEIIRILADLSGIEYIMADIEPKQLSIKVERPPFRALEDVVNSLSLGLIKKDDIWLITQIDRKNLIPRTYKMKHIHLDREFSFRESNGGSTTSSGGGASGSSGGSGNTAATPGSATGSASGAYEKVTDKTSQLPPRSVSDRSGTNSVMKKVNDILSAGITDALGGNESGKPTQSSIGSVNNNAVVADNTKGKTENESVTKKSNADYDPDSNSIFVIATEQQHMWVQEYLDSIDIVNNNIEIGLQFISTGNSKNKQTGVDWTGADGGGLGSGLKLSLAGGTTTTNTGVTTVPTVGSTGTTTSDTTLPSGPLAFGSLGHLKTPQAILSASALQAQLHLLMSNSETKTTKTPLVVTTNNREVVFGFTQNRPVVVSTNTSNSSGGSNQTTSGTNVSNENIGSTVRVLPRAIRDGVLLLSVDIEITNVIGSMLSQGNAYPIIAKTSYNSDIKVKSGYSVQIGGLEELISSETVRKLPLLGDMPIFGFAFKDVVKNNELSKFNLIITARMIDEMGKEVYPTAADGIVVDAVKTNPNEIIVNQQFFKK